MQLTPHLHGDCTIMGDFLPQLYLHGPEVLQLVPTVLSRFAPELSMGRLVYVAASAPRSIRENSYPAEYFSRRRYQYPFPKQTTLYSLWEQANWSYPAPTLGMSAQPANPQAEQLFSIVKGGQLRFDDPLLHAPIPPLVVNPSAGTALPDARYLVRYSPVYPAYDPSLHAPSAAGTDVSAGGIRL
jgi:hypothetical protein